MARTDTLDGEWDALSYRDGAVTVGGQRHELVADQRLRAAVTAVAPQVRTTSSDAFDPVKEMEPAVGAYLLALDEVPGSLDPLDFRVLVEFDRVQKAHDVAGGLFEIGTAFGRSAILLGHLARRPAERLTVCDVFEHRDLVDAESWPVVNHWYSDVSEQRFAEQYQRFHEGLPEVMVGLSESIDARPRAGTCRLVHVDGGHRYEVVRGDAATARELLCPGGVVAFGGVRDRAHPGAAVAVWELVLGRAGFVPLCLTAHKLYGTWDAGGIDWPGAIDEWVAREPDLGSEVHTVAGWPVRRLFDVPRHFGEWPT